MLRRPRLSALLVVWLVCAGCETPPVAPAGDTEPLAAALDRALRLDRAGRHGEATLLLADLTNPEADAATLHLVGHGHRSAGRHEAAQALFQRSLALGSQDWHVAHDAAQEQVRLGDLLAGLKTYARAAELVGPGPAGRAVGWALRSQRVRVLLILGRRRQARQEIADIIRDSGGLAEVRARLALVAIEAGAVEEVSGLLRGLEPDGSDPLVCTAQARLLLMRGEIEAAQAFIDATGPRQEWTVLEAPEWLLVRADVSIFSGRLDAARTVLESWRPERYTDRRHRHRRLMLAELLDGDAEEAIRMFQRQSAVDPHDPLVQAMAAFAYAARARRHDNLEAEVAMDRAVELGLSRTSEQRLVLELISGQIHQVYPDPDNDLDILTPWLERLR